MHKIIIINIITIINAVIRVTLLQNSCKGTLHSHSYKELVERKQMKDGKWLKQNAVQL